MGSLASLEDDLGLRPEDGEPLNHETLADPAVLPARGLDPATEASIVDLDITVERLRALFSRQGLPELGGDDEGDLDA